MVDLRSMIREIPDFPKEGILFWDITPLLQDRVGFKQTIDSMAAQYADKQIDIVVGVESRGFLFASALAYKLDAGVAIVRKPGKLPYKKLSVTYDLEYGADTLEIHEDAVKPGQNVLVVDDVLATGGTVKATLDLLKKTGAKIAGVAFLSELPYLKGRDKLKGYEPTALLRLDLP